MLEVLKKESNITYTENGAVTNRTSGNNCLDFFAAVGALRHAGDNEICIRFLRAFAEDRDLAMKTLFFARDVRGGLGERRVFRTLIRWLAENERASLVRNLPYIAEYGRWDDVLVLLGTPCSSDAMKLLKKQFDADMAAADNREVSLLGKWLPSVNASNEKTVYTAKKIARYFGLTDREYRLALTKLRGRIRIIENNLRERDYSFDYSKQPSKAMFKYRQAFYRNDCDRYSAFLKSVRSGVVNLHTGTLLPYELVERAYSRSDAERESLDVTWNSLEDFTTGENALVVADGSGSMYFCENPRPAAVAQSLAIYFAERNKGIFHNHFITFSHTPRLVEIKGKDFVDRVRCCASYNEVANTDIEAVFDLVLSAAVKNNIPQSELPSKLYIISDMEFDFCADNASLTNFDNAKRRFEAAGYALPQLVFWNVCSRNRQQPVTVNDRGVALVSGCSPRIFSMAMEGELDPYGYMLSVLGSERYAPIAA